MDTERIDGIIARLEKQLSLSQRHAKNARSRRAMHLSVIEAIEPALAYLREDRSMYG